MIEIPKFKFRLVLILAVLVILSSHVYGLKAPSIEQTEKSMSLNKSEKYEEENAYFDKAIGANPKDVNPWYEKGRSLYSSGNYDGAVKEFDKAINANPQDVDAWIFKGSCIIKVNILKH